MAGSSLLTLIDDIASLLDDVSLMTKVAAKKTAGVLGDDLALNAEQVSGVKADRELPVVWAVAKGSARNKLILVPAALAISYFIPWLITPLLMIGGAFLCFEGVEKVLHKFFHKEEEAEHHKEVVEAVSDPAVDMVEFEKEKIKGAIRTDFILSAEIIVIALGAAKEAAFSVQVATVIAIAVLMTIGVYGLVAGIVKLDDGGLLLFNSKGESVWSRIKRSLGKGILAFAPKLMKTLAVVGTIAMFTVGGGIIAHGVHAIEEQIHHVAEVVAQLPTIGGFLAVIAPFILNIILGLIVGAIVVAVVKLISPLFGKRAAH